MSLIQELQKIWKECFPGTEVRPEDNFFALGGDSLKATGMLLELESRTGIAVPVGQIYLTPVLREFAAVLLAADNDGRAPLFLPVKPAGDRRPLFGIAPARGGVFHFRDFTKALPDDQPFHVIEPRVSANGKHEYRSMRDLAECCIQVIRNKQPQGPYRLTGYSFGGPVAWEIARILEQEGERADVLILLDSNSRAGYPSLKTAGSLPEFLLQELQLLRDCRKAGRSRGQSLRLTRCLPLLKKKVVDKCRLSLGRNRARGKESKSPDAADMHVPVQAALRKGYDPGRYGGTMHLFRANRQLTLHRELDSDLGWSAHLSNGGPIIRRFEGDHFSMVRKPHSSDMARAFMDIIQDADRQFSARIDAEVDEGKSAPSPEFPEPLHGESLNDRFLAVVQAHRNRTAVRDGAAVVTFGQLLDTATAIAACIQKTDPDGQAPVLLHFESSWQFICATFGVLLAGRCYVPVDTEFPDIRIRQIIRKSGACMALTMDPDSLRDASNGQLEILSFRDAATYTDSISAIAKEPGPDAPAILLFTSGSTGEPKGTLISRKLLLHQAWRRAKLAGFNSSDRYGVLYVSAFMGAVNVIQTPLLNGCSLSVFNLRKRGIAQMPAWLKEERITVLHCITSVMRLFLKQWNGRPALPDLRLLIPGGEASRSSDLDLWKSACSPAVRYCTCLGSTECGTLAMNPLPFSYVHEEGPLPVGKPLESLGVRVLRADGTEAASFEEGEIVVESHYIFRGYHNCPEINREVVAFTADGKTIYKTGDFGFIDDSGVLHNAGRRDSRVKVNGTLVELAEVESVIMASGLVEETAVIHRSINSPEGEKQLVAFYRPAAPLNDTTDTRLHAWLMERLPRSMIPARFVRLNRFPQTPNGKMDRKALEKTAMEKD